ncbi:MAG: antibiotic biosynthesis monooxygenase family protein [Acidimicrobiales bacterium]|jgi:heme-degrading monooxygenase HmoA
MLEHALLRVSEGREEEFERSIVEALPVIESAPDCHGAEVRRQAEDGSVYLLLVRWSSVEAHMAFRRTELFDRWRGLTHHFYSEPPTVTHFHEPLAR